MKKNIIEIVVVLLIALFFIFILAFVPNETSPVMTLVWDSSLINSPSVSISIIQEVNDNPHTYELVKVIATSTPNMGSFDIGMATSSDQHVQIGCLETTFECRAIVI